ncbi:MAG: ATP-dependent helicase [Lachnospiraceae bacterium]|nr:ATP-dependent helicase [Lachnospiraceae bacterium]
MNLNKEQYQAAVHVNGPMLVLAGPGSGKTHLLVERIRMMIEKAGIPPESILVITFSKKAAAQMKARFERRTEGCLYPVTFGTFHAVFYHILKEYDPDAARLITEEEAEGFAEHLKRSYDIFEDDTEAGEIIGLISSYRNLSDDFFTRNDRGRGMDEPERESFIKLAGEYAMLCENAGVIDFDDMIIKCRDLFCRHESVLRKWQNRFRYFLVDEFQDINDGQYELLRLLAGDDMNVFAVGDDDQSIYAFRGARPALMKKFMNRGRTKRVDLRMNYRCCPSVIGAADTLIRHDPDRIDRPIQEHVRGRGRGYVEIVNTESAAVQAAYVCDRIEELMDSDGYSPQDIAILYRSAYCAKIIKKEAEKRGLFGSEQEKSVRMMTAHASKGLEFPCVFIIGLQEGLFPHLRNSACDIGEERRLLYVAMTRAKERLILCSLSSEHGKRPSRFVYEILEKKRYLSDLIKVTRV